MPDPEITFLTFDEAVALARAEPGTELIGLHFVEPFTHLGVYMVETDIDEEDVVHVAYEGGVLFSSSGEEDFYDEGDAPDEARKLFYARKTDLGDGDPSILGMTSEFVLAELIPGLGGDTKYRDHAHFSQHAGEQFRAFWRQI
jgi:hypothetical protein